MASVTPRRALLYAEREAHVWSRLWRGSLFSGIISPLVFLGAMGIGVGGLIERNSGDIGGLDYLAFVAPGLLVATTVQNVSSSTMWQVMAGHKWIGSFRAAVATPLRPGDVYAGYLTWRATQATFNTVPFLAIAAVVGGVPSPWGVLAIPAAVLCALAFAAPLAAFSCSQDTERYFAPLDRLIILPLFLFSGSFFPIEELPAAVRPVAWCTPMWHGVELGRGATTGSIGPGAAALHVAVLVAFILVGGAWGVRTFTRRLTS